MGKRYYIGLDVGTSSLKAVLLDEECVLTAKADMSYEIQCPQEGWRQIDPEVWVDAAVEAVSSLLTGIDRSGIACIGVTGQMHTTVFVGANGKPVYPAIIWNDSRTESEVDELKEQYLHLPELRCFAGILSTGSPAVNLYWLKKHQPELFIQIHKFLIGPDYLVSRMTGAYTTDFCEASTSSLMDLKTGKWSLPIGGLLGFLPEIYPEVRGSAEVAGVLGGELKIRMDLPDGVKVLVGTGDNPAAAIATGCLGGGYPVISLGTSGVLMFLRNQFRTDRRGKNILFSFDGEQFYHLVQGVVQSTGNTVNWWNHGILELPDLEHIDQINDGQRKNRQLLFYPHLNGDKTIHGDGMLRGAFLGLSLDTTRQDMVFAVLEGLCFALREAAECMQFNYHEYGSIKVVGGGTNSSLWMQILADIMDCPVERLDGQTGAGMGIALLAAYVGGEINSLEDISCKVVRSGRLYQPQSEQVPFYNQKYKQYKKIYGGLSELMR